MLKFRVDKLDKFLGSENKQSFFTRAQRSRIVFEILSTIVFGREKKGEVGVDRLVEEGGFSAAYPLHDVYDDLYNLLIKIKISGKL